MAKFNFYADQKCTIWWRDRFEIEADSEEKAREIMIEIAKRDTLSDEAKEFEGEIMADTIIELSPEENDGLPTIELFTENGDGFYDNVNGEFPILKK